VTSTPDSKRSENFTPSEDEVLINEMEARKAKLTGAFSATLSKQSKDREWMAVTAAVNKVSRVVRGVAEVRVRWKNLRFKCKANLGTKMNIPFMKKTGGGGPLEALNSSEVRLVGIIGKTAISGIDGGLDSSQISRGKRLLA
jgi:hypothetical protein